MLKLYNTLTKNIEDIPKKDHLNLYTCGPTVYNYAHIGNMRSYVMADLLYRTLKYDGYKPHWVMNITDIDDKTIKGAIEKYGPNAGVEELKKFTDVYYQAFLKDLEEMNVLKDEINFYRVTDVIPKIQDFILKLIEKGYAYKADDGSTYFSIEKYQKDFGDYGALVGEKFLEGKKIGARVKVDEYEKDNLSDFALWKSWDDKDAQIFWDHPVLGKGRPGWHIECSVINYIAFKGEPTDIHTGGIDLIFPHHTNEIAQSQPLYRPFTNYWHHCNHLMVDGGKMAKRLGNIYTINDLKEKGFSGQDLRYFFMTSGFGIAQNFTFEGLLAARTAREKFLDMQAGGNMDDFIKAVDDNLNFPKALASIWSADKLNKDILEITGLKKESTMQVPDEVNEIIKLREEARNNKDFTKSDELRKQIEALGYEVMDTPEGQKVKKKINI